MDGSGDDVRWLLERLEEHHERMTREGGAPDEPPPAAPEPPPPPAAQAAVVRPAAMVPGPEASGPDLVRRWCRAHARGLVGRVRTMWTAR